MYVGQELRFLGPVLLNDTVQVEVTVVDEKQAKRILVLDSTVRKTNGERVLAGTSALKKMRFA